uniref:Uncharacterized protein n=1 Tax=Hordeum vulgare subsp. vulgare TaxID=112509 RepID=A0A8I6X2B9_HORVV
MVVVVLALVRLALAPMLALGRVLRVAAGALPYLYFAFARVISSPRPRLRSFLVLLALAVLLLCGLCVAYARAAISGSTSGFKKSALAGITRESAADLFRLPRTVVLGLVVNLAFFLLMVTGLLVAVMSPHVEGSMSQGEMAASVIVDVAIFGMHATVCFVIFPALVLNVWREDSKALSQFC